MQDFYHQQYWVLGPSGKAVQPWQATHASGHPVISRAAASGGPSLREFEPGSPSFLEQDYLDARGT